MHSKEDDSVIKNIRKQKNESERKISELEQKIMKLHEKRGEANKDLAVVSRQVSESSKKVSLDDSDSKKDKVAEQLIAKLNTFLVTLKNEKKIQARDMVVVVGGSFGAATGASYLEVGTIKNLTAKALGGYSD